MSNSAIVELQILLEFQKRLPKKKEWQENLNTKGGYNKALNEVRRIVRRMIWEIS